MKRLLAIVELGGYPNLVPLYQSLGFAVDAAIEFPVTEEKVRAAIAQLMETNAPGD